MMPQPPIPAPLAAVHEHEPDVPMRTINVRLPMKSRPNASALVTAAADPKRNIDWTDIPQCSRLCRHAIVWGASPEDTQTDSEQFRSAPRTGRDRLLQAEGAMVCPLSLSRPASRINQRPRTRGFAC